MSKFNLSTANSKPRPEKSNGKRPPKRITPDYLHNSGLYYLQRYASSIPNFERVMLGKVYKSCRYHTDQDPSICKSMVKDLIVKFINSGLLNDDLYAQGLLASLKRRGIADRNIRQKMQSKGITPEAINRLITDHATAQGCSQEDIELQAALKFCQRKKIGPFALTKECRDTVHKNLAKMARAGFSFEISQKAFSLRDENYYISDF